MTGLSFLQLAVDVDGLFLRVFVVAKDQVVPGVGGNDEAAIQIVAVEAHVGLSVSDDQMQPLVGSHRIRAQDGPVAGRATAGEVTAIDPGGDGEAAILQAQADGVGQGDVLGAVESHGVVKVAGFLARGTGRAGAVGRRHGAGMILEGGGRARLIEGQPHLGKARLLAPVGDEGGGHLGQADGAGGGDVGRLYRAGYGRLFQGLQDEGEGRYVDLGQSRRVGGGQGEQTLGVAVVELVAHRGRVVQGIAYLDEGVVGVVAGLQQHVLDLGLRERPVKYGHLVYEAVKALAAGSTTLRCCGADEQGIIGVGMGWGAVGDGPLVDTVHVEGDGVVAIHHGGHVLPLVGLEANACGGVILHAEGGETQIRARGTEAKAVVAAGPGRGHDPPPPR